MTARQRAAAPEADAPGRPLPCVFCERKVKPYEPVLATNFLLPADTRIAHAPAHLACLVEAIAGETARTVVHAIQQGAVDVGIDRDDDSSIGQVIAAIVERLAQRG